MISRATSEAKRTRRGRSKATSFRITLRTSEVRVRVLSFSETSDGIVMWVRVRGDSFVERRVRSDGAEERTGALKKWG